MVTLRIGSTGWVDAGAYAIDQSPTTITSQGVSAVNNALQTTNLAELGIARSDGTFGPFLVAYTATDAHGNESPTLLRRIIIDASCSDGEEWCPVRGECEVALFCMPRLPGASSFVSEVSTYIPPVDTQAPTLTLTQVPGDIVVSSAVPGPHILETSLPVGQAAYSDPGWEALDVRDGDVSASVSALGLGALQAAMASGVPTDPAAPYAVQYSVVDGAGNSAVAVRLVHLVCGAGEQLCRKPGGEAACTLNGVCDIMPAIQAAPEPASVQLVGPEVVLVPQGTAYRKCSPDLPLDLLCDQVRLKACTRCAVYQ